MTTQEIQRQQHNQIMNRLGDLVRRADDLLGETPDWVIEAMRKNERNNNKYSRWDDE
jgi:hypothetical protein